MKKALAIFFLYTCSLTILFGQSSIDSIKMAFQSAIEEVILLKNEDQVIPIKQLDQIRIGLVGVGLTPGCDLQRDLERTTNVKGMMPPRPKDGFAADEWINQKSKEYDLFILGISDYEADQARYLDHGYFIEMLPQKIPTIVAAFGGETLLNNLPSLASNAKAILKTSNNEFSHSIMAQVIMGSIGVQGKLENSIKIGDIDLGKGIQTDALKRLRFSPPAIVDMDAQLLADSIKSIVTEGIQKGAFPGAQVLVAKDGHVVFYEAFGHHTYDTLQKVTTKDIYDFASVTKITGALPALMQLHGAGKFSLDATLDTYFPYFKNSNKGGLTFRSMLAHNAKLRPWIPYWKGALKGNAPYPWQKKWNNEAINKGQFKSKTLSPDSTSKFPIRLTDNIWLHKDFKSKKIYKAIKKSPLNEKPGYVYSGLLFYLLPDLVSQLSGAPFETYLKEKIYHKIGAYTLGFNPAKQFPLSRIVPTERDSFFRLVQLHGVVHDEGAAMMNGVSSNAGLFATAMDLAKLMQTYLNFGYYGGEQVLPENSVRTFAACQYCPDNRRGIGFDKPLVEYNAKASYTAKDASPSSFGHSGYTGTFTWVDPEHNLLLVFFSNRVYPTRDNRKLYTLNIRPRIHQALYDAILK